MKYDIGYKIGFTGTHTIEAASKEEAVEKFKDMISNEEINGNEFDKCEFEVTYEYEDEESRKEAKVIGDYFEI